MFTTSSEPKMNKRVQIPLDFRLLTLVLFIALIVCIFLWKPWSSSGSSTVRKITMSGSSTIKATPDEYEISPYFEFTGDRVKTAADATTTASGVSAKLKELGIKDTEIKSSTSDYNSYTYEPAATPVGDSNLRLSYTITVASKDLAQKAQDYFLNTTAKGQISPYATFSEAKQKQLEEQARTNAIDDAKAKAQKSAEQVGARLGKVITISDNVSSGGGCSGNICMGANLSMADAKAPAASIPVQAGQNEFTDSVQVEYELH